MSAAGKLTRTLVAMANAAGHSVHVVPITERAWASATFVGAHHVLAVEGDRSPAFAAWLDTLVDAEFAVPGQIVVDVSLYYTSEGTQLSALMLAAA